MEKRIMRILLLFFAIISLKGFSQPPEVNTYLLKDSVHLGEPFQVAVSVKHLFSTDITVNEVFPNGIEKIEFLSFPTQKLKENFVIDSGVYTLRAFGSKTEKNFTIPVAVLTTNDTILIKQQDSLQIHIIKNIKTLPESIHFASSAVFYEPHYPFDYISWGIAAGIVLVCFIILSIIFSGRIRSWWKTRKLKKAYLDLKHYMQDLPETLNSRKELEALLGKWKLTLGKIENKPLYAYTTKEVDTLYSDKELHSILREVDSSIYGKQKSIPKSEASYLLRFSEERLNKIIEQLNSKSK